MKYIEAFVEATLGYGRWLWAQVTYADQQLWGNYFYFLLLVSVAFFLLEYYFPWKKDQSRIRRDFWLDAFYMFFNFFLFSLVVFAGLSSAVNLLWTDVLAEFGIQNIVAVKVEALPVWIQVVILFVLKDFIEWWIHRLLHAVPVLWKFHKVHHSVDEMGFAAHLRFHWMESVVYKSLEYLPLSMIGFGLDDFFLAHAVAIIIGHWNHANFYLPIGPMKYILNNPQMHKWHHAKQLPFDRRRGVNFGLSLSIWDYLFGTNYTPHDSRDIVLGFPNDEKFPTSFLGQIIQGFKRS